MKKTRQYADEPVPRYRTPRRWILSHEAVGHLSPQAERRLFLLAISILCFAALLGLVIWTSGWRSTLDSLFAPSEPPAPHVQPSAFLPGAGQDVVLPALAGVLLTSAGRQRP